MVNCDVGVSIDIADLKLLELRMIFSDGFTRQVSAASPRKTREIGKQEPCSACAIRHAAVHSRIEANDFSTLLGVSAETVLSNRQTLFTEGDPANQLYSIRDGAMMVYKLTPDGRRQITGFLFPGDILGLVSDGRYVCSAEAITKTSLYCYPISSMERLVQDNPAIEHRLLEIARHELVEAQEQMLLLGRKTAKERMASFLLKMARHARDRGRDDSEITLLMSRDVIGDYLGLTTETVSRTLTVFKQKGLISLIDPHKIRLSNTGALEDIANGETH